MCAVYALHMERVLGLGREVLPPSERQATGRGCRPESDIRFVVSGGSGCPPWGPPGQRVPVLPDLDGAEDEVRV